MQKFTFGRLTLLTIAITTMVAAQGFKAYPGVTKYTPPDTAETREALKAMPPGTEVNIYLSADSFEKVVAFYQSGGKQYDMPGMPKVRKLPSGQELKQTYFIFDGAKDITTSKSWAQIQRPFIGSIGANLQPQDIRDVTVISVTQKK